MKTFLGKLAVVMLAGTFMMAGGCGKSSHHDASTGKVIKGPVAGASVYDAAGNLVATTDSHGNYSTGSTGPFSTVGGTYFDLASGKVIAAPPMKAPAGATHITPLSTMVASASPADAQLILAGLAKMGVDLNTDLSVKTAQNAAALIISETIGAVLSQAMTAGFTASQLTSLTADLVSAVVSVTNSAAPTTALSVSSAIKSRLDTDTSLETLRTALGTVAGSSSSAAETRPNGELPTIDDVTGSNGSNSGTR